MVCTPIPGGFACDPRPRAKACSCQSGHRALLLCDWKMGGGKTCDKPICGSCTTRPAKGKDLCPAHAAEWAAMEARRG
jgi:hypothetical protein